MPMPMLSERCLQSSVQAIPGLAAVVKEAPDDKEEAETEIGNGKAIG